MPRDLTGSFDANLDKGVVSPIVMLSIVLASTTEYVWAGKGNVTWDGHVWRGIGNFGKIEGLTEGSGVQAEGVKLTLSSVNAPDVQDALTEIRQGRPVKIYIGFLKSDGSGTLDGDPILFYKGAVDEPTLEADPKPNGGQITLAVESRMVDLQRVAPARLTSEEQKRVYPNDTGLDFVAALVDTVNVWGI